MRILTSLLTVLGGFSPLPSFAAETDQLRSKVTADLKQYYDGSYKQPFIITDDSPRVEVKKPWVEPLKQLAGAGAEERQQAGAYLVELLSQSLKHEQSGAAPWRATPYWGGGAENPARQLRKEVAEDLAKATLSASALPVLRWYLDHEPEASLHEPVMKGVGQVEGKEADDLRAELATKPHENAVVVVAALKEIIARKGSLPDSRLRELCHHHRASIRSAARKLNSQQGGKEPGPFDPAKAVRSEPVRKLIDEVLKLMVELPPAEAEFVTVTVRYRDDKKVVKETQEIIGWLVRREKDMVEVYTPYGRQEAIRNGERKRVRHQESAPDGRGTVSYEVDITVETSVAPAKVEDQVKQVEASRTKDTAGFDLSERGSLTGQFRGSGATLYEAILGAWLYRTGRDAEAARVLLPALDTLYRNQHLADMVRHRLGEAHGYRMLVAFAGDRDYEQALRQARLINEQYPDTRFQAYAKGLAEQLPRRKDDFVKLRLPTRGEWMTLKKKLDRTQQIDYLCERLRLLNCFQAMQPGGYFPDETQYAEPCGIEADASWGLRRGKTEVINPLTELTGPTNWDHEDKPRPEGMGLTLKDVPQLSKYLREDWYMPIVSFWRDFDPHRSLSSTRPKFASIINGLAHQDVCHIRRWAKLNPAEREKEIEGIVRWARENANKSDVELEWEALNGRLREGADWGDVEGRVEWLLQRKEGKALQVMRQFLEAPATRPHDRAGILACYREHEPGAAKDLAGKYLKEEDLGVRLQAAMLLFQVGERGKAAAVLGEVLETGNAYNLLSEGWLAEAVDLLLQEGSQGSRQVAARFFRNKELRKMNQFARVRIIRRCVAAGMPDGYRFYLPLLDVEGNELEGQTYFSETVAEAFANEIINDLAPNDPGIQKVKKMFPKTSDRIPALKKWLQDRIANPRPIPQEK